MTDDSKKPELENAEAEALVPRPKARKKRAIVLGVVAMAAIAAGTGFWAWHEQPSFCNAICHTPMDAYLPTYEAEPGRPAVDAWGNEVADARGMMAPVHRAMEGETCLSCHVPTLSEQIGEGLSWVSGDYDVVETLDGHMAVPEKTLQELVAARGIQPEEFCLNGSCHNMTVDQLEAATSDMGLNPHSSEHAKQDCGDCHKAHSASVNTCSECHDDAPIPDGWLSAAEYKELAKG